MFQRKQRRFRHRSNGRSFGQSRNGTKQPNLGSGSFSSDRPRNSFRNYQNAEKLVEKYTNLAKEALSSGDRTLSENYYQHADHYIRIVDEKNLSKSQSNDKSDVKNNLSNNNLTDVNLVTEDKTTKEENK